MNRACRALNGGKWRFAALLVAALGLGRSAAVHAGNLWTSRTVLSVDGTFQNFQPNLGFVAGEGSNRVVFGEPLPGSFASSLTWYGFSAPFFSDGQNVLPGQRFLAGEVEFANGTTAAGSSAAQSSVELDVSVFGEELLVDNHFFQVDDTWRIEIVQTPNTLDPAASADYIFFPDFPSLGSLRVYEGHTAVAQIFAKFGSVDPVSFGQPDPNDAFLTPSIVNDPNAPGPAPAPEPSSLVIASLAVGGLALCRNRRNKAPNSEARASSPG